MSATIVVAGGGGVLQKFIAEIELNWIQEKLFKRLAQCNFVNKQFLADHSMLILLNNKEDNKPLLVIMLLHSVQCSRQKNNFPFRFLIEFYLLKEASDYH